MIQRIEHKNIRKIKYLQIISIVLHSTHLVRFEPFDVAYNLRASGKELARKGDKKGEIKITRSGFDDDGLSTFTDAMIVDTVVVAKRIDIKDFL